MKKAGQEYITTAEIRALNQMRGHERLSNSLDNATQTILAFEDLLPYRKRAKILLSDMFNLDGAEGARTQAMMGQIAKYHAANLPRFLRSTPPVRGAAPGKLPRTEMHQFYSLIYQLLNQDGCDTGRRDIEAAFGAMHLPPPLSTAELQTQQPAIEALIKPGQIKI